LLNHSNRGAWLDSLPQITIELRFAATPVRADSIHLTSTSKSSQSRTMSAPLRGISMGDCVFGFPCQFAEQAQVKKAVFPR
jgi:hypothetical protein